MAFHHWEVIKSGRIKVANTPEELWEYACDYFMWSDMNPIVTKKTVVSGKRAGDKTEIETPRPYSVKALCLHCGLLEEYIHDVKQSRDKTNMWYIVVSKILYLIFVQNAELATTGVYNSIFVSRLLGFDKQDDTPLASISVNVIGGLPDLSESENQILENLERENNEEQNS